MDIETYFATLHQGGVLVGAGNLNEWFCASPPRKEAFDSEMIVAHSATLNGSYLPSINGFFSEQ